MSRTTHPNAAEQLLRRYWGYDTLRPAQEQAIRAVLKGRDTLTLMPTGGGKSVCYQIPALMLPGVTLVISPLIALMEDQVKALRDKGIPATYVNSTLTSAEMAARMEQAAAGQIKLLYLTPERIPTDSFAQTARYLNVSLIAVDEAHCISDWGHDFRPAYRNISSLRRMFPAPVIALTATATRQTAADICRSLGFSKDFEIVRETLRRENLSYRAVESLRPNEELIDHLRENDGSAIVYCGTRNDVLATARMLSANGLPAAQYHAGLAPAIRSRALKEWLGGDKKIMVATSAFGMGIDKADVRAVVHRYIPPSPEDYFQQAGRAGRDGKPCLAVILYDRKSLATMKRLAGIRPDPNAAARTYRTLCTYFGLAPGEIPQPPVRFSLEEFCAFARQDAEEIRLSLGLLTRSGAIGFFGGENLCDRAKIRATPEQCYSLPEGPLSSALESLIRSCDGIFSYPNDLDTEKLADIAALTVADFTAALTRLADWGMIEYQPARKYRMLHFNFPRDDARVASTLEKMTQNGAQRSAERAARMEDYLLTDTCRARWIETYFGETRADDCGTCDNCLRPAGGTPIEQALGDKKMTARQLSEATGFSLEEVISHLRTLMEAGKVAFDGHGKFFRAG